MNFACGWDIKQASNKQKTITTALPQVIELCCIQKCSDFIMGKASMMLKTAPDSFAHTSNFYLRARHTLQLSPIATRNTGPATIAGLPAANPQGLQAVCRAIGRISIPARKLQYCSQSQRGISYDPMTHSLSK